MLEDVSLSDTVPKRLNPELPVVDAAGGVAGFESAANGFALGVSAAAGGLASSGFLRLPNRFAEGAGAFSCAWGVCEDAPKPLNGVDDAPEAVGRLANGLLAGVEAPAVGVADVEAPKRPADGAEDVALSVFGVEAPKLNKFDAGAVAVAFGVLCAPVLRPPKMLFGLGVSAVLSFFCAFEPKPPNMLV